MKPSIQPQRIVASTCVAVLACAVLAGCASRRSVSDAATASPTDSVKAVNLYAEGAQAYRRGDKEAAFVSLKEAVRQNPNLRMAQAILAELYRLKGEYAAAAEHYDAAARLDPYSLANTYNLGVMYQYLHRLQDATAAYVRALELDPKDLKSNMNLGTVYLALGQTDDALTYLERATTIDPKSGEAWSNLGVAYDVRGDSAKAEQAYRKALELGATPATMQNLGANLVSQGRAAEAIVVLKEAVNQSNTAGAHKRYADALSLGKQFDEALKEYDAALKLDPNYYPAMNDKGFTLVKQYQAGLELEESKLKEAVALWKVSLRLNPQQPRIQEAIKQSEKPLGIGS